jgi:hypothetical protein
MSLSTSWQVRVLARFNGTTVHYERICRAMTRNRNPMRPVTMLPYLIECSFPTFSADELCTGRDWWIEGLSNIVCDQG